MKLTYYCRGTEEQLLETFSFLNKIDKCIESFAGNNDRMNNSKLIHLIKTYNPKTIKINYIENSESIEISSGLMKILEIEKLTY